MSNLAIFKTLDQLVDQWCERRELAPLRYLLPSYPMASALTDDWHQLYESLKAVRAFCRDHLSEEEQNQIGNVIVAIQHILENR